MAAAAAAAAEEEEEEMVEARGMVMVAVVVAVVMVVREGKVQERDKEKGEVEAFIWRHCVQVARYEEETPTVYSTGFIIDSCSRWTSPPCEPP